jgi:hypothetical protein
MEATQKNSWVTKSIVIMTLLVSLVGASAGIGIYASAPRNNVPPEQAAQHWAEKLKLPYRGAACTQMDTDDDGYVSCVLALDGHEQVYFQGLQCGEYHSRKAGGCKPDAKNPEVRLVMTVPPGSPRDSSNLR